MAGNPWPEDARLSLHQLAMWHEDFFTSSLNDIRVAFDIEPLVELDQPGEAA